jgi:WhiB family transcriptional regulator, redox-sensing transcriptional regulator
MQTFMSWEELALCRGYDPELFFDTRATSERKAKSVCGHCPVQSDCLARALDCNADFGVWGGLNTRERKRLRREASRRGDRPVLVGAAVRAS